MLDRSDVLRAIGNTPMVRLQKILPKDAAEVWVKLEGFNPTGSYKDRMAASIVTRSLEEGTLKPGIGSLNTQAGAPGLHWLSCAQSSG